MACLPLCPAVTGDADVLSAELAPGLGETLASGGVAGQATLLVCALWLGNAARQWEAVVVDSPPPPSPTTTTHSTSHTPPAPAIHALLPLPAGTRGTPWRMEADKRTSAVTTTAFANFSKALLPPGGPAVVAASNAAVYAPTSAVAANGGNAAVAEAPAAAAAAGVQLRVVDCSSQPMSGGEDGVGAWGGAGEGRG